MCRKYLCSKDFRSYSIDIIWSHLHQCHPFTECDSPGYLTAYSNIIMLPESCLDVSLDNKTSFHTTVRMSGSWNAFGAAFVSLFQFYHWHMALFLSDIPDGSCSYGIASIRWNQEAWASHSAFNIPYMSHSTVTDGTFGQIFY